MPARPAPANAAGPARWPASRPSVACSPAGPSSAALEELMDIMTARFGYRYVSIYLLEDDGMLQLGAQRGYDTVLETFDGTTGVVGRRDADA